MGVLSFMQLPACRAASVFRFGQSRETDDRYPVGGQEVKDHKRNGKPSRSAFIRSLPIAMSADEVIAAGKKEGLEIVREMIHKVRWQVRENEKIHGKEPKTVRVLKADADAIDSLLREAVRTEVRQEMRRIIASVT